MTINLRPIVRVIVAIVFASMSFSVLQSNASAAVADWADVPLSPSSGTSALAGKLQDQSGVPIGGADVVLFAEQPNDAAESSADLEETPIVRTSSDQAGTWTLRFPANTEMAPYTNTDADTPFVNFMVMSFTDTASDVYYYTAYITPPAGQARAAAVGDASTDSDVPYGGQDPSAGTVLLGGSRQQIYNSDVPVSVVMSDPAGYGEEPGGDNYCSKLSCCHSTFQYTAHNIDAIVGETHSTLSKATATFGYTRSSSSSLGVAVSTKGGKYGTFKQKGSWGVSSKFSEDFGAKKGAQNLYYSTEFAYSKYYVKCNAGEGGRKTKNHYTFRPVSYDGGATTTTADSVSFSKCVAQGAGSTSSRVLSHAKTMTSGVDLELYFGLSVSSQTGFTKTTQVSYKFGQAGRFCGESGYPGSNPGRLQARG